MVNKKDSASENDSVQATDEIDNSVSDKDIQVESPEDELQQCLQVAEEELEKHRDLLLRAKADSENAIKRAAREIEKVRKYAAEDFAMRLFEVKDNLERGLSSSQGVSNEDLRKGMELTLKSLTQIFADMKVEEIDPEGESFDPESHQAMSTMETGEHPPNAVIEVLQKGYRLHDRLLRPAMVVVEKSASGEADREEQVKVPV